MKHDGIRRHLVAALLALLFLFPACGGNDGGLFDGMGTPAFWALDFNTDSYYQVSAREAGSGAHCRIYVETGLTMTPAVLGNLIAQFDNVIYPGVTGAFGLPPEPGIDNDARVAVLIMNFRQTAGADGGVVAGYFTWINELRQADLAAAGFSDRSNEREMIYINGGVLTPTKSYRVIAHELQHMIHWEQKTHRLSTAGSLPTGGDVVDETWLNEAMSESAPLYCGYAADTDRISYFAGSPNDSLTTWNGALADYASVYMWAQYLYDRYPPGFFRDVLLDNGVGVPSVENTLAGLSAPFSPTTFAQLFTDWTMANIVAADNALGTIPGMDSKWRYTTLLSLSGLFTASADRVNPAVTLPLPRWSADYYQFRRFASPDNGTVAWTPASGQDSASFLRGVDNTLVASMTESLPYFYSHQAYLVVRNTTDFDNVAATNGSFTTTPSVILGALMQYPSAGYGRSAAPGGPQVICGSDRVERRERAIRARGLRARF